MANPYFNAEYYLARNPDVFAAGINTAEAAWEHYVNFGAAEALNGATSRKPAPWFDIAFYLADNPDLNTAGLTAGQLLDHFTNFGISEGRSPNADDNVDAATMSAYAVANPDLVEAFDIEDPTDLTDDEVTALAQHFYAFGYNEDRPGVPYDPSESDKADGQIFTLTTDAANVGTTGDDVFQGYAEQLTGFTSVDGLGGNDTLNVYVGEDGPLGSVASTVKIKNIETVNLYADDDDAPITTVNAARFEGAKEFWQIDAAATLENLKEGQVAGFRGTDTSTTGAAVGAAVGAATVAIALDDVVAGSVFVVTGDDVTSLSISGSVADAEDAVEGDFGPSLGLDLSNGANGTEEADSVIETLNIAVDGDVDLEIDEFGAQGLVTVDASASAGGIRINFIDAPADILSLESVTLGSGDDFVLFNNVASDADEVSFDFGAGDDKIVVGLSNNGDTALTIKTGTGADVISVSGGNLAVNEDEDGFEGSVTIADFSSADDTLLIDGFKGFTAQNLVNNAIAGAESLYEAVSALDGVLGGSETNVTKHAKFTFDGNTYVYGSDGIGLAGDMLIELTGIIDLNNDNVAEWAA